MKIKRIFLLIFIIILCACNVFLIQNFDYFTLKECVIDKNGKLIRKPKTEAEHQSISNLDLLFYKLRQWLSPRIQYLSGISWIKGCMNDVRAQNYFGNYETISRQYAVRKINDELWKILQH